MKQDTGLWPRHILSSSNGAPTTFYWKCAIGEWWCLSKAFWLLWRWLLHFSPSSWWAISTYIVLPWGHAFLSLQSNLLTVIVFHYFYVLWIVSKTLLLTGYNQVLSKSPLSWRCLWWPVMNLGSVCKQLCLSEVPRGRVMLQVPGRKRLEMYLN